MKPTLRTPFLAVGALVAIGLGGCGGDEEQRGYAPPPKAVSKAIAGDTSYDGTFKASLQTPGHRPKVGKVWRWSVKVTTKDGEPLAAKARTQFVFVDRVVGRGSRSSFVGTHSSGVNWPSRSAGYPLTFRVALTTSKGRANLDYPVQVEK